MIKQVVAGIDFSDASRQVIERARAWAERLDVPLLVIHVVHFGQPMLEEAYRVFFNPQWTKELEAGAQAELATWIKGIPGVEGRVAFGSPAEELVAACNQESLLVIGQVGHSALEHLLVGSTAARVVRHAPCDVLVVRKSPTEAIKEVHRDSGFASCR